MPYKPKRSHKYMIALNVGASKNETKRSISRVSRNFPGPSQAKMEGRKKVSGRGTTVYKILKIKRILYVLQYGWGMNSEKGG